MELLKQLQKQAEEFKSGIIEHAVDIRRRRDNRRDSDDSDVELDVSTSSGSMDKARLRELYTAAALLQQQAGAANAPRTEAAATQAAAGGARQRAHARRAAGSDAAATISEIDGTAAAAVRQPGASPLRSTQASAEAAVLEAAAVAATAPKGVLDSWLRKHFIQASNRLADNTVPLAMRISAHAFTQWVATQEVAFLIPWLLLQFGATTYAAKLDAIARGPGSLKKGMLALVTVHLIIVSARISIGTADLLMQLPHLACWLLSKTGFLGVLAVAGVLALCGYFYEHQHAAARGAHPADGDVATPS